MTDHGIVLFGDVVDSRVDAPAATTWLRALAAELDDLYATERCAPFGFTQGDELQGLLVPTADPLAAVLTASLRQPKSPVMRWVIAFGAVEAGEGPATQRTGEAFLTARQLSSLGRRQRDGLVMRSGDPGTDALLDDLAPLLSARLDELSPSQRRVGRLLVVDGLRQSEAAEALHVARPTVSVAAERARVREIERLRRALLRLLRDGIARATAGGGER